MAQPRSSSATKAAEVKDRNALKIALGTRQDGVWSCTNRGKPAGRKGSLLCLGNDAMSRLLQLTTHHGSSTPGLKGAKGNLYNPNLVPLCAPHCLGSCRGTPHSLSISTWTSHPGPSRIKCCQQQAMPAAWAEHTQISHPTKSVPIQPACKIKALKNCQGLILRISEIIDSPLGH